MADIHFEDVLKLAEQLPENEQNKLIYQLRLKQTTIHAKMQPSKREIIETLTEEGKADIQLTRESLLREVELLRQTPVVAEDSLFGKYSNPDLPEISEEEFHAQMHAIATEWEQELNEFSGNES